MKPRLTALALLTITAYPAESQTASLFTEHGYLGIPDNERYPDSAHPPIELIRERHYYAILPVETTDSQHFKRTQESSKPLYIVQKDGFIYYSTEMRGDFVRPREGLRAWVTVLQRYKYKPQ
jgi:hypothetical protein